MANITSSIGSRIYMPSGYYIEDINISAPTLASQTYATATAEDIVSGKTAWVNGNLITGTRPSVIGNSKIRIYQATLISGTAVLEQVHYTTMPGLTGTRTTNLFMVQIANLDITPQYMIIDCTDSNHYSLSGYNGSHYMVFNHPQNNYTEFSCIWLPLSENPNIVFTKDLIKVGVLNRNATYTFKVFGY